MTNTKRILLLFIAIIFIIVTNSCKSKNDEPLPPEKDKAKETVLIYMIGTNNLNSFMETDINEIFQAASSIDLQKYNILIYEHGTKTGPYIYKITQREGIVEKKILKTYVNTISSASIERMSSVITDMQVFAPAEKYGLILWSHALGWIKGNSAQKLKFNNDNISPSWYGDDFGTNMNIDELASAIPDNLFDFIWMDCCYMSTIEFIYQIRNKCNWFIGYPTEILADGMPYNQTLPYILSEHQDLVGAAEITFNYYYSHTTPLYRSCTIVIVDMSEIENLAKSAKKILAYSSGIDTSEIQLYSRNSAIPFYDFGDYINAISHQKNLESEYNEFQKTLKSAVVYKAATPKFLNITIDPQKFSGISIHILKYDKSQQEEYYMNLDWYKNVYLNKE